MSNWACGTFVLGGWSLFSWNNEAAAANGSCNVSNETLADFQGFANPVKFEAPEMASEPPSSHGLEEERRATRSAWNPRRGTTRRLGLQRMVRVAQV